MKNYKYTKDVLESVVKDVKSFRELASYFGVKSSSTQTHLSLLTKKYGIDTSHFLGQAHNKGKTFKKEFDVHRILVHDETRPKVRRIVLHKAMILSGIPELCVQCYCGTTWNNKPLTLQIDHIDGNNLNNTLENLRFLCPNCHTQTDTWGRKNASMGESVDPQS